MPDINQLFGLLFPFIIVFAVFYFLIWRPQSLEQKKRKAMLAALKKGEAIVTTGGIHGTIVVVKKDSLIVKIADKVEVEIDRTGVGFVRG